MRREESRLLARARREHGEARLEVGRRYLLGCDGFPLHPDTGIEYLTHPSVAQDPHASCLLAEHVPLHDLLRRGLIHALQIAERAGLPVAKARLGLWTALTADAVAGARLLAEAAPALPSYREAAEQLQAAPSAGRAFHVMAQLSRNGVLDGAALCGLVIQQAHLPACDSRIQAAVQTLWALEPRVDTPMAQTVTAIVQRLSTGSSASLLLPVEVVEPCLEWLAQRGDTVAASLIGKALCGIPCGPLAPRTVAAAGNLRRGAAWLMRAADAGHDDAWLLLHDLYADNRSSVANPQMAAFFLEKAAGCGLVLAQRQLGLRLLKTAAAVEDTERGIEWLMRASDAGDGEAKRVLQGLVLPVSGAARDAESALVLIRRIDPALAARAQVARCFGLTKLEALSLDVRSAARPWGLALGRNPFVSQRRLSAPRCVPAANDLARACLRSLTHDPLLSPLDASFEGDYRARSARQRRVFARLGISEDLFFAQARAQALAAARLGAAVGPATARSGKAALPRPEESLDPA
jgi:TPR repeat protein